MPVIVSLLAFLLWAPGQKPVPTPGLTRAQLLVEVEKRAFRFFWENADPNTGLVSDRAVNHGKEIRPMASVASTGYGLAALATGSRHGWISRQRAYDRATLTLDYLLNKMPNEHGWLYHFVDKRDGSRYWNCEVSSIDTALLIEGALVAGQYFGGEVEKKADALYNRLDWKWMLTNGGAKPEKLVLSNGWMPQKGFLAGDWKKYCELMFLYLLGMGASKDPLSDRTWSAWERERYWYRDLQALEQGPIFMHQMAHGFYNFKNRRDALGYDYWVSSVNATLTNRRFCRDNANRRKTFQLGFWGLNAGDGPSGYVALVFLVRRTARCRRPACWHPSRSRPSCAWIPPSGCMTSSDRGYADSTDLRIPSILMRTGSTRT